MSLYVDVIVDISVAALDRVFQYRVPDQYAEVAEIGACVTIPFGQGNRKIKGYIIGKDTAPGIEASRIKDIISIETDAPEASGQLIALAGWMKAHTGCTMAQALKTVLPVRRKVKAVSKVSYELKDREKAEQLLEKARRDKREAARRRLLEAMLRDGCISSEVLGGVLAIGPSTLKSLEKAGVLAKKETTFFRNPIRDRMQGWGKVSLNAQQRKAADEIWSHAGAVSRDWQEAEAVHLIHGITGSGKTEVYMALMEKVLAQGKSVILLIPEISLTLQTVSRFYERFGDCIAVMHSRLSAGEKFDQYVRAESGEARIMIGPRSAVFTPFSDLGMIIIDEEHEGAYKSETSPKYHVRDVAIERARMAGAMVVLGSATPSITTYDRAKNGFYGLHVLTQRAKEGSMLPEVEILDLRNEFRMKNKGILSGQLKAAMKDCLDRGEQIMLFLNRRGYAGFVSCRSCGYVFTCKHCDVSMTAHFNNKLKCHYCGYEAYMPKLCPSCGSPYIAAFGIGTQKVEDFIKAEFPQARGLRMDRDTTSGKNDMEELLKTFAGGGADILIGTQMIVKGHDFENVTLVGVLAADLSIFSGDYMASERTFQLLTQAAGRAGRGSKPGRVIIQTYQPEHYSITCAADQDYEAFYRQEILFRRMMHYPPRTHMLMLLFEGPIDARTAYAAKQAQALLKADADPKTEILGPSRANISKGKDMYRYVLYVKHKDEAKLIEMKDRLQSKGEAQACFEGIYVSCDFDPQSYI